MSDMTRAEAIRLLDLNREYLKNTNNIGLKDDIKALDMAINSLQIDEKYDLMYEQADPNCPYYVIDDDGHGLCTNHRYIPTMYYPQVEGITPTVVKAEQEPSGDLISKQAVLDALLAYWHDIQFIDGNGYDVYEDCKAVIDEFPPVNPQEPKTGHWEWLTEDKYRCSNCNHETRVDECMNEPMYSFCPFCGADMSAKAESEE